MFFEEFEKRATDETNPVTVPIISVMILLDNKDAKENTAY